MIQFQPVKNVLIDYVEVDTKHRLLAVKPARVKVLVERMQQVGRILTPLFVTANKGPDSYRLVAGATRLAAAKQLGWYEVPIIRIDGTDDEVKQVEIEENLGRLDLTDDERERLEHARKMCRVNIDKAVAELKAYEEAHPKEVAKARAEAEEIGRGASAILARRETKQTASGVRPPRKHRKTGGKKGRPGEAAAIARKHGVKPDAIYKRKEREKKRANTGQRSDVRKKPRSVTCQAAEKRQENINKANDRSLFLTNCDTAVGVAVYDGEVDSAILKACRAVIAAYTTLLTKLEAPKAEKKALGHSLADNERFAPAGKLEWYKPNARWHRQRAQAMVPLPPDQAPRQYEKLTKDKACNITIVAYTSTNTADALQYEIHTKRPSGQFPVVFKSLTGYCSDSGLLNESGRPAAHGEKNATTIAEAKARAQTHFERRLAGLEVAPEEI